MKKMLLWECIYMEKSTRKIYAERFDASNALNAITQLYAHLKGVVENPIILGIKPIFCDDVGTNTYSKWLINARQFHNEIEKTIQEYEKEGGVIE